MILWSEVDFELELVLNLMRVCLVFLLRREEDKEEVTWKLLGPVWVCFYRSGV